MEAQGVKFKRFISQVAGGNREVYINTNYIVDFGPDFLIPLHTFVTLADGRTHSITMGLEDFCKVIGVEVCQEKSGTKLMKSKSSKKK
jgi:hypothetical protein